MVNRRSQPTVFQMETLPRKQLETAKGDPLGTPAKILDAAEDIFAQYGYGGATTRKIASRAKVNIATIHYYWGSKQDLWHSVLYRMVTRMTDLAAREITGVLSEDLSRGTEEVIGKIFDIFADNPNYAILLQQGALRGYSEDLVQTILMPPLNKLVSFISDQIEKGKKLPFDPALGLFCLVGAMRIFFQERDVVKVVFGEDPSCFSSDFRDRLKEILSLIALRVSGLENR